MRATRTPSRGHTQGGTALQQGRGSDVASVEFDDVVVARSSALLVVLHHSGTGETVRADGTDLSGGEIGILVRPQDRAVVRVEGEVPPDAELAIALYVRVA